MELERRTFPSCPAARPRWTVAGRSVAAGPAPARVRHLCLCTPAPSSASAAEHDEHDPGARRRAWATTGPSSVRVVLVAHRHLASTDRRPFHRRQVPRHRDFFGDCLAAARTRSQGVALMSPDRTWNDATMASRCFSANAPDRRGNGEAAAVTHRMFSLMTTTCPRERIARALRRVLCLHQRLPAAWRDPRFACAVCRTCRVPAHWSLGGVQPPHHRSVAGSTTPAQEEKAVAVLLRQPGAACARRPISSLVTCRLVPVGQQSAAWTPRRSGCALHGRVHAPCSRQMSTNFPGACRPARALAQRPQAIRARI